MRRLLLILFLLLAGILGLSTWHPGAALPPPTAMPALPTPLPEGFTLIPAFVPAYPCALQNVDVYDAHLCRSESVKESILIEGTDVVFIAHDKHIGTGCWTSINQDVHELRVCDRSSGAFEVLSRELVTLLLPSPDGEWLAFGTMNRLSTAGDALDPHLYRVRVDGSGLQQLDPQPFPAYAVGAPGDLRWLDDEWLAFSLWDGTENGWHPFRLKTDGSGQYEAL